MQRFRIAQFEGQHLPRYNIAPTQNNPVVVNRENQRVMMLMRWGLIPSWAKEAEIGNMMINARIETIAQKPSFKTAFIKRRCLVPADGYYEWRKPAPPGRRTPFRVVLKSKELFAFAGLWDVWKNEEGEMIPSYTIITTQADDMVGKIHPRMPVILRPENEDQWIKPELQDINALMELLAPYPANLTEMYEVSHLVGNPRNDVEALIKPV
jgi:putative SOS response-associated peptidase YedK